MATHLHTDLLGLSEQGSRPSKLQASSDGRGDAFRRVLSAPSERSEAGETGAEAAPPSQQKLAPEHRDMPGKVTLERRDAAAEAAAESPAPTVADDVSGPEPDMLASREAPLDPTRRPAETRPDTRAPDFTHAAAEETGSKATGAEGAAAAERRIPTGGEGDIRAISTEAEARSTSREGAAGDVASSPKSSEAAAAGLPRQADPDNRSTPEEILAAPVRRDSLAGDAASRPARENTPHAERSSIPAPQQANQGGDAIKVAAPAAEANQASLTRRATASPEAGQPSRADTIGASDIRPQASERVSAVPIDHPAPSAGAADDGAFSISADIKSVERLVASGDALNSQGDTSTFTAGAAPASTSAGTTPQAVNAQFMQAMRAQAPMIATPAEITEIIQTRLAGQNGGDRITVQLDPPELGRVSIDFKFDAQGLQHITITGETPEALKQLRQVHFQLTQALEQQGLSGQDMTFRQQSFGQQQNRENPSGFGGFSGPTGEMLTDTITHAAIQTSRTLSPSGGLDMKL